jgi:hypothetical protein
MLRWSPVYHFVFLSWILSWWGFEPGPPALSDLQTSALDHSAILTYKKYNLFSNSKARDIRNMIF